MNLLDTRIFDLPEEAMTLLDDIIKCRGNGELGVRDCIRIMTDKPNNDYQAATQMAIMNSEQIKEEVLQKATKNDFRSFLKEVLDGEMQSFVPTLHDIRDSDPVEYHKTLQGWAKITLPTQKDVNIDVNVEQKVTMYDRMKQQYGYSAQIEEAEILDSKLIQSSQHSNTVASDEAQDTAEEIPLQPNNPVSQRLASTFDPTFFEHPKATTPTHPSHNLRTIDNPWQEEDNDDCCEYESE